MPSTSVMSVTWGHAHPARMPRPLRATVNLDVALRGSVFTFAANVGSTALAGQVIAWLPPYVFLSSRAQALRAIP